MFERLVRSFGGKVHHRVDESTGAAKAVTRSESSRSSVYPFSTMAEDGSSVTALLYEEVKFPWCVTKLYSRHPPIPLAHFLSLNRAVRHTHKLSTSNRPLSPRDFFIVQDYVLVKNSEERPWFFTYNHDISHVRFPCVCIENRTLRHNDECTDPFAVSSSPACQRGTVTRG